ncbi:MAG: hypothetical protein ACRDJO_05185 [Actinomycetota bacterium]
MTDGEPGGPHRDLWALPSEPLTPEAAQFLSMAHDLPQLMGDATSGEPDAADVVSLRRHPRTQDRPAPDPSAPDAAGEPGAHGEDGSLPIPLPGPRLRLVGTAPEDAPEPPGAAAPEPDPSEEAARLFLEMVDRADTVRILPTGDPEGDRSLGWLWASMEEGAPAADTLLSAVEEAMRHVSQSEEIRSEELRARLLDLFTDFAARQPWKEAERPGSQRVNRVADRARTERSGEGN